MLDHDAVRSNRILFDRSRDAWLGGVGNARDRTLRSNGARGEDLPGTEHQQSSLLPAESVRIPLCQPVQQSEMDESLNVERRPGLHPDQ